MSNNDQKSFNTVSVQLVKGRPATASFTDRNLGNDVAAVATVKPSRRAQRLRGIANRYGLNQPKAIQIQY